MKRYHGRCGAEISEKKILVIIDKTDKIGIKGVKEELSKEDITINKLDKLLDIYTFSGDNKEKIHS